MFIHILLASSRKERTSGWLEMNLNEDCNKLTQDDIDKYCYLFHHLKAFKSVWKNQTPKLIAEDIFRKNIEDARKKYGS